MTEARTFPFANPVEGPEGDRVEARSSGSLVLLQADIVDGDEVEVTVVAPLSPEAALAVATQIIQAAHDAASSPILM